MNIKTFVFLDSETTGLPAFECYKTRITELCLTAVQSDHIRLGIFPRVQNKINLCFNPWKAIHPAASNVSGLSNDLLEHQAAFNETTFDVIENFLSLQPQPICFVAHNGNRFDYPILKAELYKTGKELPQHILCIDSLTAFKEIDRMDMEAIPTEQGKAQQEVPVEFQDGFDELLCNLADELEKSGEIKRGKLTVEEIQRRNETTPQKNIIQRSIKNGAEANGSGNSAKRHLKFGGSSFKLTDIFSRLTTKEPTDAHRAEYDVQMLIECAAVLGEKFLDWSNKNAIKFCDIPRMEPGKLIRK